MFHIKVTCYLYSWSSPCSCSCGCPDLVTTYNCHCKILFNCHLNSVIHNFYLKLLVSNHSRKRWGPLLGIANWSFPWFLIYSKHYLILWQLLCYIFLRYCYDLNSYIKRLEGSDLCWRVTSTFVNLFWISDRQYLTKLTSLLQCYA